jgi:hypothetical protein
MHFSLHVDVIMTPIIQLHLVGFISPHDKGARA